VWRLLRRLALKIYARLAAASTSPVCGGDGDDDGEVAGENTGVGEGTTVGAAVGEEEGSVGCGDGDGGVGVACEGGVLAGFGGSVAEGLLAGRVWILTAIS
jgi:hypothetical protein